MNLKQARPAAQAIPNTPSIRPDVELMKRCSPPKADFAVQEQEKEAVRKWRLDDRFSHLDLSDENIAGVWRRCKDNNVVFPSMEKLQRCWIVELAKLEDDLRKANLDVAQLTVDEVLWLYTNHAAWPLLLEQCNPRVFHNSSVSCILYIETLFHHRRNPNQAFTPFTLLLSDALDGVSFTHRQLLKCLLPLIGDTKQKERTHEKGYAKFTGMVGRFSTALVMGAFDNYCDNYREGDSRLKTNMLFTNCFARIIDVCDKAVLRFAPGTCALAPNPTTCDSKRIFANMQERAAIEPNLSTDMPNTVLDEVINAKSRHAEPRTLFKRDEMEPSMTILPNEEEVVFEQQAGDGAKIYHTASDDAAGNTGHEEVLICENADAADEHQLAEIIAHFRNTGGGKQSYGLKNVAGYYSVEKKPDQPARVAENMVLIHALNCVALQQKYLGQAWFIGGDCKTIREVLRILHNIYASLCPETHYLSSSPPANLAAGGEDEEAKEEVTQPKPTRAYLKRAVKEEAEQPTMYVLDFDGLQLNVDSVEDVQRIKNALVIIGQPLDSLKSCDNDELAAIFSEYLASTQHVSKQNSQASTNHATMPKPQAAYDAEVDAARASGVPAVKKPARMSKTTAQPQERKTPAPRREAGVGRFATQTLLRMLSHSGVALGA